MILFECLWETQLQCANYNIQLTEEAQFHIYISSILPTIHQYLFLLSVMTRYLVTDQ